MTPAVRVPASVIEAAAAEHYGALWPHVGNTDAALAKVEGILQAALAEWGFEIERDDPLEPPPQPYRLVGPWEDPADTLESAQ